MKCLNRNNSIEEFNEILKEGVEHGFVLSNSGDIDLIIELYNNLTEYFTFFKQYGSSKETFGLKSTSRKN
jgi:hypothetical protein